MLKITRQKNNQNSPRLLVAILLIILPIISFILGIQYCTSTVKIHYDMTGNTNLPTTKITPPPTPYIDKDWNTFISKNSQISFRYPKYLYPYVRWDTQNSLNVYFYNSQEKALKTINCFKNLSLNSPPDTCLTTQEVIYLSFNINDDLSDRCNKDNYVSDTISGLKTRSCFNNENKYIDNDGITRPISSSYTMVTDPSVSASEIEINTILSQSENQKILYSIVLPKKSCYQNATSTSCLRQPECLWFSDENICCRKNEKISIGKLNKPICCPVGALCN